METYLDIQLRCPPSRLPLVRQIIAGAPGFEDQPLQEAQRAFGYRSAMALVMLLQEDDVLAGYFEGLEEEEAGEDGELRLRFTCGTAGLGFGGLLMHALASHCSELAMEYDYDEDPPEDQEWPLRLRWDYEHHGFVNARNGQRLVLRQGGLWALVEPETAGPVVPEAKLEALRATLRRGLLPEHANVDALLRAFEEIATLLCVLDQEFQSECAVYQEDSASIRELREQETDFLGSPGFGPYFIVHLRGVLQRLLLTADLDRLIQTYDEGGKVFHALTGFLGEGGGEAILGTLHSQSDYECWREHFIEQLEESEERDDDDDDRDED